MQNTLIKKLKLKANNTVLAINKPSIYDDLVTPLPNGVTIYSDDFNNTFDAVHLFVKTKAELDIALPKAIQVLKRNGNLWILFPKKTSKLQSDLTRDTGWDGFLKKADQLSFITLISFDHTWSAFCLRKGPVVSKQRTTPTELTTYIDTAKRIITLPQDVKLLLEKHKEEYDFFSSLSFTNRKEYVTWIISAKKEETRAKRLELLIEKLTIKRKNPSEK